MSLAVISGILPAVETDGLVTAASDSSPVTAASDSSPVTASSDSSPVTASSDSSPVIACSDRSPVAADSDCSKLTAEFCQYRCSLSAASSRRFTLGGRWAEWPSCDESMSQGVNQLSTPTTKHFVVEVITARLEMC